MASSPNKTNVISFDLRDFRSERRLCDEVHMTLACRWFCRLGLDGDVPDHSTPAFALRPARIPLRPMDPGRVWRPW